ncbi:MAG: polyphosphate polymerase domain-containing protein [Bacteroidetes Order II. Incertae sedis bacterium]|nr:polyphosphate polymerase domain-containing protein [Bacteroidetes Order II. bacterium]
MTHPTPTLAGSGLASDVNSGLQSALMDFVPITLRDLEAVSLQNRVDAKFLIPLSVLPDVLGRIQQDYGVLDIEKSRIFPYVSCYFDTPDLQFYHHHHNGRPNRLKIRLRQYVLSDLFYFEVKQKRFGTRTEKIRLKREDLSTKLKRAEEALIHDTFYLNHEICPQLTTCFNRITLAGGQHEERVTIDTGLLFSRNGGSVQLSEVVIVEVKQPRNNLHTPIRHVLRQLGASPKPFSKYAIGMALMMPTLRQNAFKPVFLNLKRLYDGRAF